MADKAWKRFEREVAAFLGGRRIPVAEDAQQRGSLGDVELKSCFVSCRLRSNGSPESWWREAERAAREKGLVPVVIFRRPRSKGMFVLLSMYDLGHFTDEVHKARKAQWEASMKARAAPKRRAMPPEEL